MLKSVDIILKGEHGEKHFVVTQLNAVKGFMLTQKAGLLLVKAGVLDAIEKSGMPGNSFSLDMLTSANLNHDDLLAIEGELLTCVEYCNGSGQKFKLSWDTADRYCDGPKEIFDLLKESFKLNFGFLSDALKSISPTSAPQTQEAMEGKAQGKAAAPAKNSSKHLTFQMR